MFACPATDDFFRSRIDQMIDLRHPLAVLSSRMPWQDIEARVAHLFVRKAHASQSSPSSDTSKPTTAWTAVTSKGRWMTGCMLCCVRLGTTSSGCRA